MSQEPRRPSNQATNAKTCDGRICDDSLENDPLRKCPHKQVLVMYSGIENARKLHDNRFEYVTRHKNPTEVVK